MSLIILDDIIAAISTPPGNGGIGIVRLSGKGCIEKADEIFKSRTGTKLADKAGILGGIILILIGLEIFITSWF